DVAREAHAGGQRGEVVASLQEVEADRWRGERVGAFEQHGTAGIGPQMDGADRKAGKRVRHGADPVALGKAPDAEIELNVRPFKTRIAAGESAGADAAAGQRPAFEKHVL